MLGVPRSMEHIVSIPYSHTFNTEKKKSGLCYLTYNSLRTSEVFPVIASLLIFRRERSDDRKYVCCSQAILKCATSENTPFLHRVLRGYICSHYKHRIVSCRRKVYSPIQYVTLHFGDWRGAVSLRYRNCAEIIDSSC